MILYAEKVCPASHMAQLTLAEMRHAFMLRFEKPWEHDGELLRINPGMHLPVLKTDSHYIVGAYPITEALGRTLLTEQPNEVRRLIAWFNGPFWEEVTRPILFEKKQKLDLSRAQGGGPPDLGVLRTTTERLADHLDYVAYLAETRNWLAGNCLSLADIAAASHLACVDYLTLIPWDRYPFSKQWYARIKSRPSFQPILQQRLPKIPPSKVYLDLDF